MRAFTELRAAEVDVGADRVLVTHGVLTEETYTLALAKWLGLAFELLDHRPRRACPLADNEIVSAKNAGLLHLTIAGEKHLVIAIPRHNVRAVMNALQLHPEAARNVSLTSNERLDRFVGRYGRQAIGGYAADSLRTNQPQLSAATGQSWSIGAGCWAAAFAVLALIAPSPTIDIVQFTLATIFLAWTILRLFSICSSPPPLRLQQYKPDNSLPVYTIVVALYREAAVADGLIKALRRLDYPPEKLDIKLVLEPDDHETHAALAAMGLSAPFDIIIAPNIGPRTKPKALNAALPFAQGTFIAVYDAEDRPEPAQLRLALEAFAAESPRLACVQARLTIDNTSDSWLTRIFTAEYAGLFDVFLPGLAAWRLPLPLGGSSNHFRTAVLREVGAWDPYNVTEDADLGMRLARLGYLTTVISSTTYEEAPAHLDAWLKQRTRWFKGWVQTWLVHMRSPRLLRRQLGWTNFAAFQLLVGGTVLAALVHLVFVADLLFELAVGVIFTGTIALGGSWMHAVVLVGGYLASAGIGVAGLARRKLLGCAWALVLIPVYWILLSLAAWRAVVQALFDPYRWEKTEHGLAKTSRLRSTS